MARDKEKPDVPLASPARRLLPMLLTFALAAGLGPHLLSAYWLNTFTTVACLTLVAATVALLGRHLPYKLGLMLAAFAGVTAGMVLERCSRREENQ